MTTMSNQQNDEVNFRPDIASLNSYKTQGYKEWWALAEFVDNSISSFVTNKSALEQVEGPEFILDITVVLNERDGFISIVDNAAGISKTDMQRAFTSGVPPKNKSSLSQFGLGLKAAGIWFANHIEVTTTALGEPLQKRVVIDLDHINATGLESYKPDVIAFDSEAHGTIVKLTALSRDVPADKSTLETIREYLASIYRDFIRTGDVRISVNAIKRNGTEDLELLTFEPPTFLVAPRVPDLGSDSVDRPQDLVWRKEVNFKTSTGKQVSGWAGLRAKGSYQNTGFVLLWHRKVILGAGAAKDVKSGDSVYKPQMVYGAQNSAASLRLFGELDVSEFQTTNRKDNLTWSHSEETEFLQKLKSELDALPLDLIRQAYKYKVAEKTIEVVEEWKNNLKSVAQSSETVLVSVADSFEQIDVREPSVDTISDENELELVAEYAIKLKGDKLPISVTLGFVSIPGESTFIVQSRDDTNLVLINRESAFSKAFGDPRLNDLTSFTRLLVSLGLAEIYTRRVTGDRMVGTLRRMFNEILDSDSMTSIELPEK
jgi:hypothetical protein